MPKIAAHVLPLGLPEKELSQFIDALSAHNQTLLLSLPGVDQGIILAGTKGLREAYLMSFRYIWIMAAVLAFVALIC
jgi:hypothetical protein